MFANTDINNDHHDSTYTLICLHRNLHLSPLNPWTHPATPCFGPFGTCIAVWKPLQLNYKNGGFGFKTLCFIKYIFISFFIFSIRQRISFVKSTSNSSLWTALKLGKFHTYCQKQYFNIGNCYLCTSSSSSNTLTFAPLRNNYINSSMYKPALSVSTIPINWLSNY